MSAASTVLSIAEILEQILAELPPLDIIRCQGVNNTWKILVASSPLLQYKTWLRNDYSDAAHQVRADDFNSVSPYRNGNVHDDYEQKRYIYNVSKHLHPILVGKILQHQPKDPSCNFDPLCDMEKYGFGGRLTLRPILLRGLKQWYEKHRNTEHLWGNASLYRPDAREISWEIPDSGGAGIPLHLEAVHDEDSDHEFYTSPSGQVSKRLGQPLVLTLSDLMRRLDEAWERWLESELQEHYLSHDGAGCDFDKGIPAASCLTWQYTQEDYDDPYVTIRPTFGTKMTMEEHIKQALLAASE
jgi:hypothetical protein